MPQLVKGGKFVYGLAAISPTGTIFIPPEAMKEYRYREGDKVIVMGGSRTSGGLSLTKTEILDKSELSGLLNGLPQLRNREIAEAEIIENKGRRFCWTVIREGGRIDIPLKTLSAYGLKSGDKLAVGRGSYLAIAFIARGPIMQEALKHPELEVFGE
jgi:bifunctional DNA-binding transcriptional regulator/antitoxin component of YhaV-PrlF toxin-antitoxin module